MKTSRMVAGALVGVMMFGSATRVAYAATGPFEPTRDAQKDLVAAEQQATAEHKLILLDVGGNWCGWCVIFDRLSHEDAKLHDILDQKYVVVHVNVSRENENKAFLAKLPRVSGYPHFFVLKADGKVLVNQDTDGFEQTHEMADGYDSMKLVKFFEKTAKKAQIE